MTNKIVSQVMSYNPITVKPKTPLKEAIKILAEKHISGLPVVDENGKLVGIVSETDLMWQESGVTPPPYIMLLDSIIFLENPGRYEKEIHKALGETVEEIMTKNPLTTTSEQRLSATAKLMHERSIHRLPVVDENGKVIGILTRGDIIRAMAAE
ncbi:MAG: CBS domain-containing protein [Trichodesmium sp. St16_bin4-tuft]|nr:CBS domain-containing protein [Trichodesmium sp. MAG_R01]MDE5067794.1 CBS domain-containing protein [Trichodesmium sp. St4_bin8_1]MDE5073998.1 CBS domain-containing protein [Trichodesmium sp. St5_bin8]MDE5077174.1 CBS domain-containing protein [Trichodesmium sp. St2_bin6]MDE5091858.1 CBS domain-containing protein [Trichodesmium sp. St18_bin3_1_1]MDE5100212.1 CBS domain-containing protein [Trichodesmium sp. St16_bin4-tuft]MDE5104032.1 CBS domain-containing protein [Trichodesmium sp. St19_bi